METEYARVKHYSTSWAEKSRIGTAVNGLKMSTVPEPDILAVARSIHLLTEEQLQSLRLWASEKSPDAMGMATELLRRKLVTVFQAKYLLKGRGPELILGPYLLQDKLGEGGMGRVYKALHMRLGRETAVKVIRKEKLAKTSVVQRFRQEIRAASQLSHPNIVLALDADEVNGIHYFAMEYIEGVDLGRLVQEKGPLPVIVACDYIRQVAAALQHAWEQGLVHRDVKPSNILVTPKGKVKLLDLGLAHLATLSQSDQETRITQEGIVLGTPDFVAPEQWQNPLTVSCQADVYSLGGTLYFLLSGRVPFEGESAAEKLVRHVTMPPPSVRTVRPDIPEELDSYIRWMMAKKPEDRPQTPVAVRIALTPFAPATSASQPVPQNREVVIPAPATVDGLQQTIAPETALRKELEAEDNFSPAIVSPVGRRSRQKTRRMATVMVLGCLLILALVLGWRSFSQSDFSDSMSHRPQEFVTVSGIKFIRLPKGEFMMGTPENEPGRNERDLETTTVIIDTEFYISETEITHKQFQKVMGRSPAKWPLKMRSDLPLPVENVTWNDATEFCIKLSSLETERVSGWQFRLPWEFEWEYACRAGTSGPFWSGDTLTLGTHAIFNYSADAGLGISELDLSKPKIEENILYPVKSAGANRFGLHDMSGSVWEWCLDAFDEPNRHQDHRMKTNHTIKTARGGSFREGAGQCRSGSRKGVPSDSRNDDLGFRVVYAKSVVSDPSTTNP